MAGLEPWGLISRIYVGDNSTLLRTKYISCEPHGFREECFSHYKSMGDNDPRGGAGLHPRGLVGRIYV